MVSRRFLLTDCFDGSPWHGRIRRTRPFAVKELSSLKCNMWTWLQFAGNAFGEAGFYKKELGMLLASILSPSVLLLSEQEWTSPVLESRDRVCQHKITKKHDSATSSLKLWKWLVEQLVFLCTSFTLASNPLRSLEGIERLCAWVVL